MATNNATNTSNPVSVAQGGTGDSSVTAYAVLCGGTTSTGAVQSVSGVGTSGQVLTSNGASALPTWQAASSSAGAWNLLNTATASASANIAFSSTYITSTYTTYVVIIRGINNATGTATFNMDWSTNNGTSYLSSGYNSGVLYNNYSSATQTNANSTTTNPLTQSITDTNVPLNGIVWLSFPASNVALFNGQIFTQDTTSVYIQSFGSNSGTTTINNIRFSYSTGNITSGTISLYGISQ
jgi:hypothetical protein